MTFGDLSEDIPHHGLSCFDLFLGTADGMRKFQLFEVKDDAASNQIASRIIQSETSGLENGGLVASLGTHDSPDFLLVGDLSAFKDYGGYHTYKLHISIHNLTTGKVVWKGIQTKIKL